MGRAIALRRSSSGYAFAGGVLRRNALHRVRAGDRIQTLAIGPSWASFLLRSLHHRWRRIASQLGGQRPVDCRNLLLEHLFVDNFDELGSGSFVKVLIKEYLL